MFPEALMLHYLDDLDSKMEAMRAHFEREANSKDRGPAITRRWGARCSIPENFMQGEKPPAGKTTAEGAGAQVATPTVPESPPPQRQC
jgi:hypothetical protein